MAEASRACRPFLPSTGIYSGKPENGIREDGNGRVFSVSFGAFLAEAEGGQGEEQGEKSPERGQIEPYGGKIGRRAA